MLGPVFQLDGDSYSPKTNVEVPLRLRLAAHARAWTGQSDLLRAAGLDRFDKSIPRRLAQMEQALAGTEDAILIGRSSGARVVTRLAVHVRARAVICLGYPFRRPGQPEQPKRYAHLAQLTTPTLILQGISDAYGGREILHRYPISPAITVEFMETDHACDFSPEQWDAIAARILGFCASLPPARPC
jgi:predicted alpha/beta-hydrolase family hydrolase